MKIVHVVDAAAAAVVVVVEAEVADAAHVEAVADAIATDRFSTEVPLNDHSTPASDLMPGFFMRQCAGHLLLSGKPNQPERSRVPQHPRTTSVQFPDDDFR
ncbi:MAG: hypothetical protein Rhob2KO_17520 [Rhodopirellula baltica]